MWNTSKKTIQLVLKAAALLRGEKRFCCQRGHQAISLHRVCNFQPTAPAAPGPAPAPTGQVPTKGERGESCFLHLRVNDPKEKCRGGGEEEGLDGVRVGPHAGIHAANDPVQTGMSSPLLAPFSAIKSSLSSPPPFAARFFSFLLLCQFVESFILSSCCFVLFQVCWLGRGFRHSRRCPCCCCCRRQRHRRRPRWWRWWCWWCLQRWNSRGHFRFPWSEAEGEVHFFFSPPLHTSMIICLLKAKAA